jgi:hypothetical protein
MHRVDHGSRRSLHRDGYQTPECQSVTDTARIPSARCKVGRQEGAEARLHVRKKKVQPLDRPQTPLFALRRIDRSTPFSVVFLTLSLCL